MSHSFLMYVEQYGYLAVAVLVAIEGLGIPISGGASVVAAGTFAAHGSLSVVGVMLAATIGAFVGSTLSYCIGRRGGRALLQRYGHWIRLDAAKLAKTESYYARHGVRTIFFGRYIAPVRVFGGLLAGVARMPFATFMVANVIGAMAWAATWSALGYAIGKNISIVKEGLIEFVIAVGVFACVWLLVRWLRARKLRSS